jgi:L-lactate dehydrogenase complex protein LldG
VFQASDVIETLNEAAAPIRNFYEENPLNATVSFISGPSRTADIEMRLILGVHGPAETHAIIVN